MPNPPIPSTLRSLHYKPGLHYIACSAPDSLHYMDRDQTIQVRLTADEKERLVELAGARGVSAYIRSPLAGDPGRSVDNGNPPTVEHGTPGGESPQEVEGEARVRELVNQGLTTLAAKKIAGLEAGS